MHHVDAHPAPMNSPASYHIEAEILVEQPALAIKGTAKVESVGDAVGAILGKVKRYLEGKGVAPAGAPYTRTFSFANGEIAFEAGFPVPVGTLGSAEITVVTLPKGEVATTVHVGSQENSQAAYEAIHAWIAKNKKKENGAPWEVYLSDAATPADKARMQVFYPIR